MIDLLKTNSFIWTDSATHSFNSLKGALISAPVLALPDFLIPFDATTEASSIAVGAVLSQHGGLFSKKMTPRMTTASTYVRELYAIMEAIRKWRQYLLGRPFRIFTDHQSIKESGKSPTSWSCPLLPEFIPSSMCHSLSPATMSLIRKFPLCHCNWIIQSPDHPCSSPPP
ncbi:Retrovirus-related Pol polyprotein from transposon [Sesamum alatum]|uniref:Retrovirus-related Pol polyprotein from transposon n=1 Tax=Sesamum alatum TaxID=300844 RepID=A0AAE2CP41_9LAMI|nr:Retrovirus-related Pol polyprotein from transposon [Sesamum alatum]